MEENKEIEKKDDNSNNEKNSNSDSEEDTIVNPNKKVRFAETFAQREEI